MTTTITAVYNKPDATFASGEEAYADKNSTYSADAVARISTLKTQLLSQGVMTVPETYTWDQASGNLSISRIVSNSVQYYSSIKHPTEGWAVNTTDVVFPPNTGWTFMGTTEVQNP